MSNKVINFGDLKRKQIRKELADGVVIYNPSMEQKKKILNYLTESCNGSSIDISGSQILMQFIPMLTNINISQDMKQEEINAILDDPDDLLIDVVDEIKAIITALTDRTLKTISEIESLPKEKQKEIFNQVNKLTEKTDKEKEIEELENKLKSLKEEK